jgi:hypothetical protein
VSLFKREPRSVYCVYDEQEYLAGEENGDSDFDRRRESSSAGMSRAAGLALLALTTVAVAAAVAAYASRTPSRNGPATARLGSAAPPAASAVPAEPVASAAPASRERSTSGAAAPALHALSSPAPGGHGRAGKTSNAVRAPRRDRRAANVPARQPPGTWTRPGTDSPAGAAAPPPPPPPPPVPAPASPSPPRGAAAEFGFER